MATRRTASSGESVGGRVFAAFGGFTPAQGLAAASRRRTSHSKKPRHEESTRASERGEWPLP
jgi:hypothetical protein